MGKVIGATCIVLALLQADPAYPVAACNLYQKAKSRNPVLGQPCASYVTPYSNEVPSPAVSGTFYARDVPKCESGLDSGCNEVIRCLDGTRPMVHIDPVANSTKWVFTVQGGGSCGEQNGIDPITNCMDIYEDPGPHEDYADAKEMSTEHAAAGTDLPAGSHVPARKFGHGILRDTDNAFATYNRVAFNKCSYDRFMGNGDYSATWYGDPVILHFHGRRIINAVLKDLNQTRGTITIDNTELMPLSAATRIVFAGNSGGAGGLIMNMEYIKGKIASIARAANVSFVLDARALPGLEAEGKFEPIPSELYAQDDNGTSPIYPDNAPFGTTINRSLATYSSLGEIRTLLETWGNHASMTKPYLDAGCLAFHSTDATKCFDEMHVAAHHTNENVFWHQTLQDSVHAKSYWFWVDNWVPGFIADDGSDDAITYNEERIDRVVYQLDQIYQNRKLPPPMGAEVTPTNRMGVYAVYGNKHNSLFTDDGFFQHAMTRSPSTKTKSFERALSDFLASGSDACYVEDTVARFPFTNPACRGWTSDW